MLIKNPFFKKRKNVSLSEVFVNLKKKKPKINFIINDIKDLNHAQNKDISFFNSIKYLDFLKNSKVKYVITNHKYEKIIKKFCYPIVVENVLSAVAEITSLLYPNSHDDAIDFNLNVPDTNIFKGIKFGKNVLIGNNVKIGKNSFIGHNTIIESNVVIGSNSIIGNNVLIKYSLIGNNVRILDGSIIGKKGFGFFPKNNKNFRYPHIGMVVIEDHVEVGCNNTIDRGSISNTIIGKNTFIDNQVHIAHNVKIGKNCIITGQVGIAGSSKLGHNVHIGGQAGISGHLIIGNNVHIGGGSGVIKNVSDNSRVMGYPAKKIRDFLKENK